MDFKLVMLIFGVYVATTTASQKNVAPYQYYQHRKKCDAYLANPLQVFLTPIQRYLCNIITATTPATTTTTTTTTAAPVCTVSPSLVILYTLVRSETGDTFQTTIVSVVDDALNSDFFVKGQSPGLVATTADGCDACGVTLVPVNSFYSFFRSDYYYATSETDAAEIQQAGYARDSIVFYCSSEQNACGASVALYRYEKSNGNHMLTADMSEGEGTYQGILCYIWPG